MMCFVSFGQTMQVNYSTFFFVVITASVLAVFQKHVTSNAKASDFKEMFGSVLYAPSSLKIPCRMSGVSESELT